jgi:hypothetical protein
VKIRMKVEVSGTRDGAPWPPRGDVLEVGDDEGAQLCAAGLATPVVDDKVETAVPSTDAVETRDDTTDADDLDALQKQAEDAGVKVDKRWKADRLRQEIAAAKKA